MLLLSCAPPVLSSIRCSVPLLRQLCMHLTVVTTLSLALLPSFLQVVFTIHNMNYGQKKIAEAACYSQKITTVSPTYAFEVGGHPALAGNTHKFMGILNGIDPELWDPQGEWGQGRPLGDHFGRNQN